MSGRDREEEVIPTAEEYGRTPEQTHATFPALPLDTIARIRACPQTCGLMKVLLHANVLHDLRAFLAHHETLTAAFFGWSALQNGSLINAAEAAGFEVLLTGPQDFAL